MLRRGWCQLQKGGAKGAPPGGKPAGGGGAPKTRQPMEVGSNRSLPADSAAKAKEMFVMPDYPGKRAIHNWRFFIRAGKAATGPPVGQEFSKYGLKAMDFAKQFNDKTKPVFKDDIDLITRIQVYHDLSYSWRIEPPPTAWFIMRAVHKKRRETGPPHIKQQWTCFITLEMCYEIAKYKQFNWSRWDYPSIDFRARKIAQQARRMGIAVIGVDAPNSPVKGMTPAQYEKQAAAYREQQAAQLKAEERKALENAPLLDRLHRPDFMRMSEEQLTALAKDSSALQALYTATRSKSKFVEDKRTEQEVLNDLKHAGVKMTKEDLAAIRTDWRFNGEEGFAEDTPAWTREAQRGMTP